MDTRLDAARVAGLDFTADYPELAARLREYDPLRLSAPEMPLEHFSLARILVMLARAGASGPRSKLDVKWEIFRGTAESETGIWSYQAEIAGLIVWPGTEFSTSAAVFIPITCADGDVPPFALDLFFGPLFQGQPQSALAW